MSLEVKQIGIGHESGHIRLEQSMHKPSGKMAGAVVYQERLLNFDPEFHPFLNAINGTNMAIDAGFTGVPVLIYENGNSSDADSGATDVNTTDKLVDAAPGQNFLTTVSVGMVVRNTTAGPDTFAHVTAIDDNDTLSIDSDIFQTQPENYTIGAEWPGTAVQGSWDFTTDISISNANNNDEARFDNPHTSVMSNYVAVTGGITLTTWNETNNSLFLSFSLAGVLQGNSVDLNDFIDTGLLGTSQNFVIPLSALGLSTQTVDDMNLVITRSGGARPTVDLDNIQFEKAGGTILYRATTPKGTVFHIRELRIAIADNIASIVTNGTMEGLAFDDFMGITSPLTNGIVFSRVASGKTIFSVTINQLGDFLATGSNLVNHISDGTNTFITLLIEFPEPIILEGSKNDFLQFAISDDLSTLLQFTAAARGALEI